MVLHGQRNCAERKTFLSAVPHDLSEEEKSAIIWYMSHKIFRDFNFLPLIKIRVCVLQIPESLYYF